jgi:hypothetical protein
MAAKSVLLLAFSYFSLPVSPTRIAGSRCYMVHREARTLVSRALSLLSVQEGGIGLLELRSLCRTRASNPVGSLNNITATSDIETL